MTNLPRLELTENPNKKNDFIIFRHQIKGKKVSGFSKKVKISSKKTRKHRKTKTRKHKKRKSIFNIF
jgi:hypothetical protein